MILKNNMLLNIVTDINGAGKWGYFDSSVFP